MTWVVAASTIFGYGALYSDVQVTFRDGSTRDLVQKAYPISNFIVAGFSGSVKIGFMLIKSLKDELKIPAQDYSRLAWDPIFISKHWSVIAKSVFDAAPKEEKAITTSILMVGISPTENSGLGAKVIFTRFTSPHFHPNIMTRPIKLCSIGSGAAVKEYKHSIKPLFRLSSGILKSEIGQLGGWASQLGFSISHTLNKYPRNGISRHIHILIVSRGSIRVETNNENIYPPDGTKIEIRMPSVAQDYAEFLSLAQSEGHEATGAAC
jgi:hypothetical protein